MPVRRADREAIFFIGETIIIIPVTKDKISVDVKDVADGKGETAVSQQQKKEAY